MQLYFHHRMPFAFFEPGSELKTPTLHRAMDNEFPDPRLLEAVPTPRFERQLSDSSQSASILGGSKTKSFIARRLFAAIFVMCVHSVHVSTTQQMPRYREILINFDSGALPASLVRINTEMNLVDLTAHSHH